MTMQSWSGRSLAVRAFGAMLLLGAWRIGEVAVAIGHGDAGHEPAPVYALCLLAFLCASAGAALLANGTHLFGKVPMGELWTPHLDDDRTPYEPEPRRRSAPRRGA
jgi:hypothetical protein